MQNCCLEGCESYKFSNKQKIGYYKFPIDNKSLLDKWLSQIRIPNWVPDDCHQICSTHFHVDDIDFSSEEPQLKENAVPVIFPLKHFQSIYVDELASVEKDQRTKIGSKSLKKQAIACKKKMNFIDPKNALGDEQKSIVLLCTPTEQLNNNTRIQINSKDTSNLKMKKIALRNNKALQPDLNPYILIVSENAESKIPFTKPQKTKQAVLKIQIEKKVNNVLCDFVLDNSVRNNKNNLNESHKTNEVDSVKNNVLEEIEIDDVSSTKKVIFKFDPTTGEITVQKRDKLTNERVDLCEKHPNAKKINSSLDNNRVENNENAETTAQESSKNLEEITNKEKNLSSHDTSNLNNQIMDTQENIAKEIQTSTVTAELEKQTKQQISTSTVESQKPLKETQISTSSVASQNPVKKVTSEVQTSTPIVESQKPMKKLTNELQTPTPTVVLQKPAKKLSNELQPSTPIVESQKSMKKLTKEPQTPIPTIESQKATKQLAIELETLTPTVESQKSAKKLANELQTSTPIVETQKPAKKLTNEQQTSTPTTASQKPTKKLTKELQTSTPTITSQKPAKKLINELQTSSPTIESHKPTKVLQTTSTTETQKLAIGSAKEQTSFSTVELRKSLKRLAKEPQTSTLIVDSKTPSKKVVKEPQTLIPTIESKIPAKKAVKEAQTPAPAVESKIPAKKVVKEPQTSIITVASKAPAKKIANELQKITSTPIVSLQRTVNKPTQAQSASTIKKDAKTVNNKQIVKIKANNLDKKRKSDVIIINTSEDEDEQLPKDNKKLKTNSNTVILHDQAVITIIE